MNVAGAKDFILQKLTNELPAKLTYHSVEHTYDVYEACNMIAKEEDISKEELDLLLTAALFHDSGFLVDHDDHENNSCKIAREYLPRFGFTYSQLDAICGMIMATRLPQSPTNLLEKIICDADLDYLGRDDFFLIADKLYNEFLTYKIISTKQEWYKLQVSFFQKHTYFTGTALKTRLHKKEIHLEKIKEKWENIIKVAG